MLPLLLSLSLIAADPPPNAGPIRLPAITVNADPKPMPGPDAAVPFAAGQRYVFDSPVKCHVRAYPPGALTWVELKGPRDITAKFVGGTGEDEDRTFAGPFVYRVTAKQAGCVELVMTPYGFTKDEEIRSIKLDVLGGCKADPTPPQPGPGPAPTPTPGPLFDAVQAAFGADGSPTKQADKAALAAVYAAVAAQVKDPAIRTEADLAKVIGDARAARVGTRLSAVREIIGREFGKVLPADATAALTDADREAARAALTRFSTLLEAVK